MSTNVIGVGLGSLGQIELDFASDIDAVEIVAGTDVDQEARRTFTSAFEAPAYETVAEALEEHADELDAAIIVTPHALHYDQVMACFDAGLDVFVEKPMVTGIENAVEVVETADRCELILQVGYQRHFHPGFKEVKRLVDSGRIGEIHMVSCYLGQDHVGPQSGTWRTDPSLAGGGQLYDSGSHLLDALLWTTGSEPVRVASITENRGHEVDVNTALSATLDRDGDRISASIGVTGDGTAYPSTSEGLIIWGTEGRIQYIDDTLTVAEKDSIDRTAYETEITGDVGFEPLVRAKLGHFFSAITGEAEIAVSGEYGLLVTALTEAAYEASESGRTVDVRDRIDRARETVAARLKK